jgi:hypothetical protein
MGSQTGPESGKSRHRHTLGLDESGQLSIDFFIGLSIFLITLIIAATMISGLLVGLRSKTIDYDAVAYRTGVILVEDPGEPNAVFNYNTITEEDQWEFIGADQKDLVRRFGLTLYKSTPRTLSEKKINSFFDTTQYNYPSDYRERIIFGSYPYRFNIKLYDITNNQLISEVGDHYNADSSYGYIRRVVLVKNQTRAVVDMNTYHPAPGDGKFKVELDYQKLMNIDRAPNYIAPQYWVEPPKENITINLTNIGGIRNLSQNNTVRLNTIRIEYRGQSLSGTEVTGELPLAVEDVIIDGTSVTYEWPGGTGDDTNVSSTVNITLPAGFFIQSSAYADVAFTKMNISYEFDQSTVNVSEGNNIYFYDDRNLDQGFTPPSLKPAILEVRVW